MTGGLLRYTEKCSRLCGFFSKLFGRREHSERKNWLESHETAETFRMHISKLTGSISGTWTNVISPARLRCCPVFPIGPFMLSGSEKSPSGTAMA